VIYGRITLGGTMQKLGVTKDGIKIGKHANLYDETRLWDDSDRRLLNEFVEEVYDTFTAKAAKGRGLTQKRIKELGGGRIWSGRDAVDNGLVDELGGLDRAVEVARELASAPDAKVVYFPKDKTFMDLFEDLFSMKMSTRTARAIATPDPFALLEQVVPRRHLDTARFVFSAMSADRPPALAVMTQMIDIR
jgi:ClpP class serine protease